MRRERLAGRATCDEAQLPSAQAELQPEFSGIDVFQTVVENVSTVRLEMVAERLSRISVDFNLRQDAPSSRLNAQIEASCAAAKRECSKIH